MNRQRDLDVFYSLIDELRSKVGGFRKLGECSRRSGWPARGVYFFFTEGEFREDGVSLRVVRVGTHAVSSTSRTDLWSRLRTHRGNLNGPNAGGGNQRGSVFRRKVGSALILRDGQHDLIKATWNEGSNAPQATRTAEVPLEREVSAYIRQMPFVWLEVGDAPGARSDRKKIEANSIALLSNFRRTPIDAASVKWLGLSSEQVTVRESGLWNSDHVSDEYDPGFLDLLGNYVHTQ